MNKDSEIITFKDQESHKPGNNIQITCDYKQNKHKILKKKSNDEQKSKIAQKGKENAKLRNFFNDKK